jgi:hypothetical protein
MSQRSTPADTADQTAPGARKPVTLVSTPWIRLVASHRTRTAEPVPIPHAPDRAA